MWIVYVLQHTDSRKLYFGVTKDLKQRIQEHNSGGKKYTTRLHGIWVFVYAEAYRSKEDALLREKRLKRHASGKHELLKRLKNSLIA